MCVVVVVYICDSVIQSACVTVISKAHKRRLYRAALVVIAVVRKKVGEVR